MVIVEREIDMVRKLVGCKNHTLFCYQYESELKSGFILGMGFFIEGKFVYLGF